MPSALRSTAYNPSTFFLISAPPKQHFVHPSTYVSMSALAAHSAPLLALHLSTFADAFAIGLSVPHGLFDGTGIKLVLRALQAELAGQNWDPPAVSGTNPVTEAVAELLAAHPAPEGRETVPPHGWMDRWPGVGVGTWIGWRMRWGKWCGVEEKGVFIGDELLAPLVVKAKAEVAVADGGEGGGGYVSTEDVLKMWFVRVSQDPFFSCKRRGRPQVLKLLLCRLRTRRTGSGAPRASPSAPTCPSARHSAPPPASTSARTHTT